MKPRDITRRVLGRPIQSPYARARSLPVGARWVAAGVAVWLVWVTLISDHSLLRIQGLRHELRSTGEDLSRVQTKNAALENRLRDPVGQAEHAEEMLRRQGMARPGELVYRFDPAAGDSTAR